MVRNPRAILFWALVLLAAAAGVLFAVASGGKDRSMGVESPLPGQSQTTGETAGVTPAESEEPDEGSAPGAKPGEQTEAEQSDAEPAAPGTEQPRPEGQEDGMSAEKTGSSEQPEEAEAPAGETAQPEESAEQQAEEGTNPEETPGESSVKTVEERIAGLTMEEKLGQLVMFGLKGTTAPTKEYKAFITEYHIGNFILLGDNIRKDDRDGGFDAAEKLTKSLRRTVTGEIPALISIDVEGGSVVRFRWPKWPDSAKELGKENDPDLARRQFEDIAVVLAATGIDLNLAPVLDVAKNPDKTALGKRIISSDPEIVSSIGTAVIDGTHQGGCLSAAKHFPGHGGTTADSHNVTPVVDRTAEELRSYDLVPFRAAIAEGVDAVLCAHILYPALDGENIASRSEKIITGLLRQELGFDGVVITDDFRMGSLTKSGPVGEAAVQFILAGGDLVLCGPDLTLQKEIMEGLYAAVADGTLTEARIDESLCRILTLKDRGAQLKAAAEAQQEGK